jgi:hypothetical protein
MRSNPDRGPAVETRIATALWNQYERDRIIAVRAHEIFCSRGCEDGLDLDDWRIAEQELASHADDVLIAQSEAGFDISIAGRPERRSIVLSIAPSSLLVVWTNETHNAREDDTPQSTLSLFDLPDAIDPENVEVTFREGRVRLSLSYAGNGHFAVGPVTVAQKAREGARSE